MTVFLNILFSFLAVGILGGLLGIGLAFASRLFAVKKDERIASLEAALPGLNCGACGYAGCASYAEAIALNGDSVELTLCTPGAATAAGMLAQIMGVEVDISLRKEKKVAQVFCRGKTGVTKETFSYEGMQDCNAMHILYGGNRECKNACIGFGSCMRVCPVDAIDYDEEGLVWVDKDICISCGKCIEICPTGVIKWVPYSADYIVACNNRDKGAAVRKYCAVGCIACKICERKSPEGGFLVEDNLAGIDFSAKGSRKEAALACPPQCIIEIDNQTVKPKESQPREKTTGKA